LIKAGNYQVWPNFALEVSTDLSFEMGKSYQLLGANGSGKSSFIQKLLLPAIREQDNAYIVYLQQQMHLQLYALKAHAAFHAPGIRICTANDAAKYLLADLQKAYAARAKNIYIVADECPCLELIRELPLPHCLIVIDHHEVLQNAGQIRFEAVSRTLSKVSTDA
jgi:energy-coupling factor transporter ATP-binding protein EcfA2